MSRMLLLSGLLGIAGCGFVNVKHTRSEQRAIGAPGLRALEVSTFNGSIDVEPHDSESVELDIEYTGYGQTNEDAVQVCESLKCEVTREDGLMKVTAVKPAGNVTGAVSVRLKVPAACACSLKTSNGRVTVSDLAADVSITTSNGAVRCSGLDGSLDVKTSNGSVDASSCFCDIRLRSSNGKISYSGQLRPGSSEVHTSNGSVTLEIPADTAATVQAKTSNGRVTCNLPVREVIKQTKTSFHAVVGSQNDPAEEDPAVAAKRTLSIQTSNGSVTLRPQNQLPAESPDTEN